MKIKFIFFCALFGFFINIYVPAKAQAVNEQDSLALVDLYNNTNGTAWTDHTNWLTVSPVSEWYGIIVENARVTEINLYGNNLTGSIPPSLGNLAKATSLLLPNNQLSGSIPPELANLTSINWLALQNNQLSGNIPAAIGNLTNITRLELDHNNLNGNIPPELGNLADLFGFDLSNNQLSGSIPPELGNLSIITNGGSFNLSNNQLRGSIPPELSNLSFFSDGFLDLSNNQLSGDIPPELGNTANLTGINLSNNQLSGSIPSQLANLTNLSGLYLNNNQLNGNIPFEVGNLMKLRFLVLNDNQLSGSIPSTLGNLVNPVIIRMNNNLFNGSIPAELGNLSFDGFGSFDLSNNQLSGSIPSELGNLSFYYTGGLDLSGNQLTGIIPPELGTIVNLTYLDLSDNKLYGNIPSELSNAISLFYLDLSNNQLSGDIPAALGNLVSLDSLFLNNNRFIFNGMELIAQTFPFSIYSPQAIIPVDQNINSLSVSAGGTLSNNTYNWYMLGQADTTIITGDSVFHPSQSGKYFAAVTNSVCKQLTLYTDTIDYTTLPVSIIDLKAYQESSIVKIDWTSVTEINVASYKVQRSSNAHDFTIIGILQATGNGTQRINYSFTDLQPLKATNYYRLKILDKDGTTSHSKTVVVNIKNDKKITIVYPIPAKDILHVQTNGKALFSLINQSGKILLTANINVSGTINVSGIAAGLYYLKNNSTGIVQKVMVIR